MRMKATRVSKIIAKFKTQLPIPLWKIDNLLDLLVIRVTHCITTMVKKKPAWQEYSRSFLSS